MLSSPNSDAFYLYDHAQERTKQKNILYIMYYSLIFHLTRSTIENGSWLCMKHWIIFKKNACDYEF